MVAFCYDVITDPHFMYQIFLNSDAISPIIILVVISFPDSEYWKFQNQVPIPGYPKFISEGFIGIPSNVDAAFVWGGNGKIYFFKGTSYWKFDPEKRPPVSSAYPRPISNWEGIPDNIDDATQYTNGYSYFFKNGLYYRFDDTTFRVSDGDPSFPRPVGFWWFGCPASQPLRQKGGAQLTCRTSLILSRIVAVLLFSNASFKVVRQGISDDE